MNAGRNGRPDGETLKLRHGLAAELKRVRGVFREIVGRYVFRVDGRFEEVARFLAQERHGDGFFEKTPEQIKRDLKFMTAQFKSLKLKPEKGRRKDLKRIESLAESLLWAQELEGRSPAKPKKGPPGEAHAGS